MMTSIKSFLGLLVTTAILVGAARSQPDEFQDKTSLEPRLIILKQNEMNEVRGDQRFNGIVYDHHSSTFSRSDHLDGQNTDHGVKAVDIQEQKKSTNPDARSGPEKRFNEFVGKRQVLPLTPNFKYGLDKSPPDPSEDVSWRNSWNRHLVFEHKGNRGKEFPPDEVLRKVKLNKYDRMSTQNKEVLNSFMNNVYKIVMSKNSPKRQYDFVGKRSFDSSSFSSPESNKVNSKRYDLLGKKSFEDLLTKRYDFIGKKSFADFMSKRYDFLGKRENVESLMKRYDFIGKRDYNFLGKKDQFDEEVYVADDNQKRSYDLLGKRGYDLLGKKSYDLLGKRNYNLLGKRNYNLLGKRNYNLLGKRNYNLLGKRNYNLLGKKSYDLLGKRSYDLLGKRNYNLLGKRGYDLLGKRSYNLLGKRGYDLLGKRSYDFLGKRSQPNPSIVGENNFDNFVEVETMNKEGNEKEDTGELSYETVKDLDDDVEEEEEEKDEEHSRERNLLEPKRYSEWLGKKKRSEMERRHSPSLTSQGLAALLRNNTLRKRLSRMLLNSRSVDVMNTPEFIGRK